MARKDISDVQVIKAYIEAVYRLRRWPENLLHEWTGEPTKVCWSAMKRAFDRELIDYGISIRRGWATVKGLKLLAEEEAKSGDIKE